MSSATPLVSVIIPAFNAGESLRETLESAARQSWQHLEIIIVDDGSTDQTARIAADFCAADERAKLISQSNHGVSAARNRGIAETRGAWIAPLDADDLWHPEKVERQLAAARANPDAGLVYCWSRLIDDDSGTIGVASVADCEGEVLADHLRRNFIGNGSTPMIRREALGDLRYDPRFQACADYLLQLKLAMSTRFAVVRACLTGYRFSQGNMSSDAFRMIREHIQLFDALMPDLPEAESRIAREERSRWLARYALVLLRRGNVGQFASSTARAFLHAPRPAVEEVAHQLKLKRLARSERLELNAASVSRPLFLSLDPDHPLG